MQPLELGCIPSDLATGSGTEIEEERRLLYVAMTRAKDDLHLIVPHRFFTHQQHRTGDRHVYAARSRFIPASILPVFECRAWTPRRRQESWCETLSKGKVDLAAKMRAMWG